MSGVRPRGNLRSQIIFAVFVLVVAGVVGLIGAMIFVQAGIYDVSARKDHTWPVAWLLHHAMQQSVAARAGSVTPPDLDDPALILRGAAHFDSGCAPCHGAPGHLASPIAQHMTPVPPGLYAASRNFTPNQLFWIIQNGVKMTAMPAWPARGRSDEIWAMVAFLEHLPGLDPAAYRKLAGESGADDFLPATPSPAGGFDVSRCSRCHGTDGRGRNRAFPQIAGLNAAYIAQSLKDFRDGSRPSGFMQPIAAAMSDAEISAAASYYAAKPRQFPSAAAAGADSSTVRQGAALAIGTAGVAGCFSCHLRGSAGGAPDLAGQPADYLASQLHLLASGRRDATPDVNQLASTAHHLSDQQITAVSNYLASLPACGTGAMADGCAGSP